MDTENNIDSVTFSDLFDLKDIQNLQDNIATSYNLAAIITDPDGHPITKESNFTQLCRIIRANPEGYKRCIESDRIIGKTFYKGFNVQKCLSCGLWDSGASIYAGEKHIANFLFGQAHDGSVTEKTIRKYAEEIGIDADKAADLLDELPVIEQSKFKKISKSIYEIVQLLSSIAYKNMTLQKSLESNKIDQSKYISLVENTDGSLWSVDRNYRFITGNSLFRYTYTKAYGNAPKPGDLVINSSLPEEVYNLWKSIYDRALTGEKYSIELGPEYHFRDFKEYMEYRFNPIIAADGAVTGVNVFGRDISARNKYLNQIKLINNITEEVNKVDYYNDKLNIISDGIKKLFSAIGTVIWLSDNSSSISDDCLCTELALNINDDSSNNIRLYPAAVSGDADFISIVTGKCPCNIFSDVGGTEKIDEGFLNNNIKNNSDLFTSEFVSAYNLYSITGYRINGNKNKLTGIITVYCSHNLHHEEISLMKTVSEIISNTVRSHEYVKALTKSENLFRQIYEHMSIGVVKLSIDFKILNANEAYCKMLGYNEDELIGKSVKDFTAPEYLDENIRLQTKLSQGLINHYRMEKALIHKSGKILYGILDANLIRDTEGSPLYFFGSVLDITEQKKIESQMLQNEKMKAIGHLAGGIAHDFNNILSAVMGYAELSLLELPESDSVSGNVKQILQAGERAKYLVKQILSFSSHVNENKKYISIIPVVNEAFNLLKASIPSSIDITFNHEDLVTTVFANSTNIHEIIMNLCTNSSNALNEKGSIAIKVSEILYNKEFYGEIGISDPGYYNVISIKDDGPGIDKDIRDHIFEPFFTTNISGTGSGMGLSVVFGIVNDHKGNIQVMSSRNNGTEIIIYLPSSDSESDENETFSTEVNNGHERIIFIDDEVMIGKMIKKILEKSGYSVTLFSDSIKAFEYITDNPDSYDLIITDQTMPGLTGFELAMRIRAVNSKIPIILCTGYSNTVDESKALNSGIQGYINKPVRSHELKMKIREVFENSKS